MTDQRTEEKIDFFELEVAEEEKKEIMIDMGDALEPSRSMTRLVHLVDISPHSMGSLQALQDEVHARVAEAVMKVTEAIEEQGLAGYETVIYSRPDHDTDLGMAFSVGAEERKQVKVSGYATWYDDAFASKFAALCTAHRNPLTGGEV